jgi:DNA-binding transcriptional LysR family regulator
MERSMTFEELRSLLAVNECKSFSAAARKLGCSQPAVSQHIQRLEAELGLRLFEREQKGVKATPAGEVMLRAASESLGTLDHALHHFAALRAGESGSLVMTTGGTTVKHFMRGAIKQWRRKYPRVKLQFRTASSSGECVEMLLREAIDLAFVTIGPEIEGVRQVPLLELDYVLLAPRNHALAQHDSLSLRDLQGLERIALVERTTSSSQLATALRKHGIELEPSMTVCDWDTAIHLVELGLGCSIVPSWHAHAAKSGAAVVATPIEGLPPMRVGWALRASHALLPPAREFMHLVKEDFRSRSPLLGVRKLS